MPAALDVMNPTQTLSGMQRGEKDKKKKKRNGRKKVRKERTAGGMREKRKEGLDRTYLVWVVSAAHSVPNLILISILSRWILLFHFAHVVMEVRKS